MKKLLAVCFVAFVAQVAVAESYLWWHFAGLEMDLLELTRTWVEGTEPTFSGLRVGVMEDKTGANVSYLNIYNTSSSNCGTLDNVDITASSMGQNASSALGDYAKSGYSYYIELVDSDNSFVGRSEDVLSYSDALERSYIKSSILKSDDTSTGVWQPTSFTVEQIPEPTSAMFLLVGVALLALKRKCA